MNDAIISLIITGGFAWLTLVVRYCFISKCDSIQCCCCKIHRAVGIETNNIDNNNNNNNEISINVKDPVTPNNKNISEQKSFRI